MINLIFIGKIINYAALYMTAALGASISIKTGDLNLGGEGQIYSGGFIAAIILAFFSGAKMTGSGMNLETTGTVLKIIPFIPILLASIAAIITGGLVALLSAVLKKFKHADFLLTSFIISSAIVPLLDGLVTGPFRNTAGTLLATPFINKSFRLQSLVPPSSINAYLIFAILISIATFFLVSKTHFGKQVKIYGTAKEFALYAGFSESKITFASAFISGAFHGLTGAAAIVGTYYTCHKGFAAGFGWNALSVALIAKANPLFVIPVSFLMSIIINCANQFALLNNFDFDISGILQGLILFAIAITLTKGETK